MSLSLRNLLRWLPRQRFDSAATHATFHDAYETVALATARRNRAGGSLTPSAGLLDQRSSVCGQAHQRRNLTVGSLRWRRCWLRPVGAPDIVQHALALAIDEAGEQLLCVPEYQGPGEDLRRGVQGT